MEARVSRGGKTNEEDNDVEDGKLWRKPSSMCKGEIIHTKNYEYQVPNLCVA